MCHVSRCDLTAVQLSGHVTSALLPDALIIGSIVNTWPGRITPTLVGKTLVGKTKPHDTLVGKTKPHEYAEMRRRYYAVAGGTTQ
jgi:hypothetical protein